MYTICRRLILGERNTLQNRAWTRKNYIRAQYMNIQNAVFRLETILGSVPPDEVADLRLSTPRLRYMTDILERCSLDHLSEPRMIPGLPPFLSPLHRGALSSPTLPFLHQVRLFDRGTLSSPGLRGFRDADWL